MDWEDYINFDIDDITRFAGDEAVELIQSTVESTIEPLIRAVELAQSDRELEMAEAELEAYSMDITEAESLTEEIELNNLINYMGQSYKGDMDMIERYLELTGQGGGYGGGGGGGGGSTPSPIPDEPYTDEEPDWIDDEDDDYFWDMQWDDYLTNQLQDFFEIFF
tara:strand:- start:256 stop:750 length:495 start_codon:yes stop_codon:yes gene_type:complete